MTSDILVVVRDSVVRESIARSLMASGYRCDAVCTPGEVSIDRSTAGYAAACLELECDLSEMRNLSRWMESFHTPVVALGGPETRESLRKSMRLGAHEYVDMASLESGGLIETVRQVLEGESSLVEREAEGVECFSQLRAQYDVLKQQYDDQVQVFENSQESYYIDLSRMVTIISNIMDGIVFADAEGHITLMNPVAEDLLGIKSFMAIGRDVMEFESEGELVGALCEDYSKLGDRREVTRTVEVHHSEQDLLYIRLHTSQVRDYQGNFAGTLSVMQNVTAEYKTDQLKNQYLSIVAHELRTPLTGIKTFSTMMAKGTLGELNDKQSRVVESIREQSLRLEQQIDKLINLGQIESNEYCQDLESFDFGELVVQAVAPFAQAAKDRNVSLDVDGPGTSALMTGDRSDMRRAIQALVENAIKFAPDDGRVTVETVVEEGQIEFSVQDDGIGIDPRYHLRIFEKFFQVEDPLTRHHGGAGLGLFFTRNIVMAHDSTIRVTSELGQGARFSFSLPVLADDKGAPVSAGSASASASVNS